MPYLHWESPYGQKDRREAFNLLAGWYENSLRADEERHNPDPADPDPGIGDGRPRGFDQSENSNYYSSILDTKDRIQNAKDFIGQWKTDRLRSVYPFDDDLPYHSTRTLEQYFCPNVFPAVENDKDNPPDKKLLAVDQLWMVVTGKGNICCDILYVRNFSSYIC